MVEWRREPHKGVWKAGWCSGQISWGKRWGWKHMTVVSARSSICSQATCRCNTHARWYLTCRLLNGFHPACWVTACVRLIPECLSHICRIHHSDADRLNKLYSASIQTSTSLYGVLLHRRLMWFWPEWNQNAEREEAAQTNLRRRGKQLFLLIWFPK